MVCGYCQDVGRASQGLEPAANNAARAKQKDRERDTHRIEDGKKCFSIVRNARVMLEKKMREREGEEDEEEEEELTHSPR